MPLAQTPNDVADALAAAVNAASGVGIKAYSEWPDRLDLPAVVFEEQEDAYHETFGTSGKATYTFRAYVVGKQSQLRQAQRALRTALAAKGSGSVLAAIEADRTLGGVADDVACQGPQQRPHVEDFGGNPGLVNWATVTVLA